MDRRKVSKARRRLQMGAYDDPDFLDAILTDRVLDAVIADLPDYPVDEDRYSAHSASILALNDDVDRLIAKLRDCPIGKGDLYRDLVWESLTKVLHQIIDKKMSRTEFRSRGGKGDFELHIARESIGGCKLIEKWCDTYAVTSIIGEVKNLACKAPVRAVDELLSQLVTSPLGQLGVLVSRNGFTRNASVNLSRVAATKQYLILPLDHSDLTSLLLLSTIGLYSVEKFLRRKETVLLQNA